jgi:proton-dependent oligopeptide transporter, POT family
MSDAASPHLKGDTAFFGHPKGLAYLAFTEAWERFSFSGMHVLLVLYMVGHLLQPGQVEQIHGFTAFRTALESVYGPLPVQPLASAIFGLYTGLVFLMPVFGGYLGDRVFGQHRMVMAGAVLMAGGHFLMAFEPWFLGALLLLVLGSGCLKGNISTQVASLYAEQDRRRTDAFQIFSMGINVGVIGAPLVCGTLGEVYGWHYGFGAAGIGMLIGLIIYIAGRRHLPPDRLTSGQPAGDVVPRDLRLLLVLALAFTLVTCFLVTAGQLGNTYNLWLKTDVDRTLGGVTFPVTWFHIFTPLFSVLLTPAILRVWQRQAAAGREPALLTKMGLGLSFAAVAMLLLAGLSHYDALGGVVSFLWLLPMHVLITLAYLFVWPVGLALFSRAAPPGARAMFLGVFFITSFVASNLVGWIGGFYETLSPAVFWALHAAIGAAGVVLVLLTARSLGRAVPPDTAPVTVH